MLRRYFSELKSSTLLHRARIATLFFLAFGFSYVLLNTALDSFQIRLELSSTDIHSSSLYLNSVSEKPDSSLQTILKKASMHDNTVILTTLNEAWTDPNNSIINLFLTSFKSGHQTKKLLNHLVIIALDQNAYTTCKNLHAHCFYLTNEEIDFSQEAFFMTPNYLKMMWQRVNFLISVLELGYNFLFTDADVMWFRNPFPQFYPDADFQIACDHFSGNSTDVEKNIPNGGFSFVRSNIRSIEFYKYWYSSREIYPDLHDQDVLNKIKFDSIITDIGLKLRFLDTAFFGGFCEPSQDLNKVCTMHANCCAGLENKVHDLRIMLQDWKNFMVLSNGVKSDKKLTWRAPKHCKNPLL